MNTRKFILIVMSGIVMILADYFNVYYDSLPIFFSSEVISLIGWSLFIYALEQ